MVSISAFEHIGDVLAGLPNTKQSREKLGSLIKSARLTTGLSQAEFAKKAGISRDHFAKCEGGKANVSMDLLERIAAAADLSVIGLLNHNPVNSNDFGDEDARVLAFQTNLLRLMKKKDLSVSKLAYRAEIHFNTARAYVEGKRMPPGKQLTQIAKALETTPSELLKPAVMNVEPPPNASNAELRSFFEKRLREIEETIIRNVGRLEALMENQKKKS